VSAKEKVLIMKCDAYDPDRIAGIVQAGMEELGVTPTGNVLLKPNVVAAHKEIFPHAFTRSEFLDGVIAATKARAENAKEIAVGGDFPLNLAYRQMRINRFLNGLGA